MTNDLRRLTIDLLNELEEADGAIGTDDDTGRFVITDAGECIVERHIEKIVATIRAEAKVPA
jgi:hypothetical protein